MTFRARRVLLPLLLAVTVAWARDDVDLAETCFELATVQEPEVDVEAMRLWPANEQFRLHHTGMWGSREERLRRYEDLRDRARSDEVRVRAGLLDDAIRCLNHALERNHEAWTTRLILAGYLIRAKRDDEGWKMFATVEKPRGDENLFERNLAWFYGSVGRKVEFLEHLEKALQRASTPDILDYIDAEADFDAYRGDADFVALLEKHRRRLTQ